MGPPLAWPGFQIEGVYLRRAAGKSKADAHEQLRARVSCGAVAQPGPAGDRATSHAQHGEQLALAAGTEFRDARDAPYRLPAAILLPLGPVLRGRGSRVRGLDFHPSPRSTKRQGETVAAQSMIVGRIPAAVEQRPELRRQAPCSVPALGDVLDEAASFSSARGVRPTAPPGTASQPSPRCPGTNCRPRHHEGVVAIGFHGRGRQPAVHQGQHLRNQAAAAINPPLPVREPGHESGALVASDPLRGSRSLQSNCRRLRRRSGP